MSAHPNTAGKGFWNVEEDARLRDMLANGKTFAECGLALGRSKYGCRNRSILMEMVGRGRGKPSAERVKVVIERKLADQDVPDKPKVKLVTPQKLWCLQCDRAVFPTEASSCTSQWCSAAQQVAA